MENIRFNFQNHIDNGICNGAEWIINCKNKKYHEAIGFRDLNSKFKFDKNLYFRIWSMTKPIVGFAAMQLVEKRFLFLDDTIEKYLPAFKNIRVLNSFNSKLNETQSVQSIPTIRQLLQHTAGFTYNSCENSLAEEYEHKKLFHSSISTLEEEIDIVSQLPLLYQPGSKWHYSISIDVLARIIEIVTNDSLINVLDENIFTPLKMHNTNFFIPEDENKNLVDTYEYNKEISTLTDINFDKRKLILYGYPKNNHTYARGGHGLYSTADDYIKFANMLVDGKNEKGFPLVTSETLELMRTNSLNLNLFPIEITSINTKKDKNYINDLDGYGWGLGLRVLMNNSITNTKGVIGEFGWSGYASTYFLIDPKNQITAVLMMQILEADRRIKQDFYNNIFKNL